MADRYGGNGAEPLSADMAAPKGTKPPGGSRKGKPNKITKALKDMILGALDDAGGQAYLTRQAQENPGPFLALVGKVLPVTLAGDSNNPVVIQVVRFADENQP